MRDVYFHSTLKIHASGDPNGEEIQTKGNICLCIADSPCCTVETNITLQGNYTPIKSKNNNQKQQQKKNTENNNKQLKINKV